MDLSSAERRIFGAVARVANITFRLNPHVWFTQHFAEMATRAGRSFQGCYSRCPQLKRMAHLVYVRVINAALCRGIQFRFNSHFNPDTAIAGC